MLYTVRGMWHSTQELPVLFSAWCVWLVSAAPSAWWQRVHRLFTSGFNCGFLSTSVLCGTTWQSRQVALPFR
jgi:hypothetical protein